MSHLFDASKQWATRPADERFWSLAEMNQVCAAYRQSAAEATVRMNDLHITPQSDDLHLVGNERSAKLTHWSFGQLCNRVGAPAGYLRTLTPILASNALSYGLKRLGTDGAECKALFHANGSLVCRAFTSDAYARIWNCDVTKRLLDLGDTGWRVPPARPARDNQSGSRPATEADVLSRGKDFWGTVKVGDMIAPAGLYANDHDMFAFLVNENVVIDDGSPGGLARGFFVSNSEVGAAAFKITRFLYRNVCGNHIVWDAKDVQELRIVHTGANDRRFGWKLQAELRQYAAESQAGDVARIESAKRCVLGATKDEVLDSLFGKKVLPRKTLDLAYDRAIEQEATTRSGSPHTAWGFAQGVTELSQETPYADERVSLDRAAGKVLSIAF